MKGVNPPHNTVIFRSRLNPKLNRKFEVLTPPTCLRALHTDLLQCPECQNRMRVIAVIDQHEVVEETRRGHAKTARINTNDNPLSVNHLTSRKTNSCYETRQQFL